jgi:ATP-dependent DNA helicase RecG
VTKVGGHDIHIKNHEWMRLAIDEMRKSVPESRTDGKPCPKVGAVLFRVSDESVITAHRGELRVGDHAEFTLLERKNRDQNLRDSILYSTLEPCAPGARSFPKLGCAERIVNARIKTVYVGIEDPHPSVARKGIAYMEQNGIEVQMFPPDLQKEITEANRDFLEDALERARDAEEVKPQPIILSPLEAPNEAQERSALNEDLLTRYRESLSIGSEDEFERRMVDQGVLGRVKGKLHPTGFGLLLFGKNASDLFPQAAVQIVYTGEQGQIRTSIEGPLIEIADRLDRWLRETYPETLDRSGGMERQDANRSFRTIIREGLSNALVHRDYSKVGAKVQVTATADLVIIKSPGKPVEPITIQQLIQLSAPSLSRNPLIHRIFARLKLAEEQGFGLQTMREARGGMPRPSFSQDDPFLVLTIQRNYVAGPESSGGELSDGERNALEWLQGRGGSSSDYAATAGINPKSARERLNSLVEKGLASRSGKARSTRYAAS